VITTPDSKILVVGPSWIGDMIMAQSLFMTIKANNASSRIQVLAPAWSEPVLQRMPEVDATIDMPVGHGALELSTRRRIAGEIRPLGFDQAIVLPGSLKSALIPWLAKIPRRSGFLGEQRWGLLNDVRRLDKMRMPQNVQRYVSLGHDRDAAAADECPQPQLQVNEAEKSAALAQFSLNTGKPVLALCPGAEFGPAKQWPEAHFAEVAKQKLKSGWSVWIFGSDRDLPIGERINDLADGGCVNLCGATTLGQAIDLISCARYTVTNDSGLMHIAAAAGSHVIAIYGSSSDTFTPPLTALCDRLNLSLDCSPCFKRECPLGHLNCLNNLLPSMVLERIVSPGQTVSMDSESGVAPAAQPGPDQGKL
jgi:heptosyltransferase-2